MRCLLTLLTMLYCTQNLKKRSVIISINLMCSVMLCQISKVYFCQQEAFDKLQRMRFQLRLSTSEDQRAQILRLQNAVR